MANVAGKAPGIWLKKLERAGKTTVEDFGGWETICHFSRENKDWLDGSRNTNARAKAEEEIQQWAGRGFEATTEDSCNEERDRRDKLTQRLQNAWDSAERIKNYDMNDAWIATDGPRRRTESQPSVTAAVTAEKSIMCKLLPEATILEAEFMGIGAALTVNKKEGLTIPTDSMVAATQCKKIQDRQLWTKKWISNRLWLRWIQNELDTTGDEVIVEHIRAHQEIKNEK